MPKILASIPAPQVPSARASTSSSSPSGNDRLGGFEQVLSGARRRSAAPEPKDATPRAAAAPRTNTAKDKPPQADDAAAAAQSDQDRPVNDVAETDRESRLTTGEESAEQPQDSDTAEGQPLPEHDAAVEDAQAEADVAAAQTPLPLGPPVQLPSQSAPIATGISEGAPQEQADADESSLALPVQWITGPVEAALPPEVNVAGPAIVGDAIADALAADSVGEVVGASTAAASASTGVAAAHSAVPQTTFSWTAEAGAESPAQQTGQGQQTPAPAAASNAAQVVESVDPQGEAAPLPAATVPSPASSAAPDQTAAAAARAIEGLAPQPQPAPTQASIPTPAAQPLVPEMQFAEANHPNIVAGVRGQLLPSGGTMHIHLDPPELGPLAVTIRIHDGVIEASFEASNDQAAKLLSHSLSNLKATLESQGVNVERLQVQHAPKDQPGQGGSDRDQHQGQNRDAQQEHSARQEHQRREMLRRMWRKLTGAEDPLDMVA